MTVQIVPSPFLPPSSASRARIGRESPGQLATVAQYRAYQMRLSGGADIPIMAAYREHILAGLRKAGMPEE